MILHCVDNDDDDNLRVWEVICNTSAVCFDCYCCVTWTSGCLSSNSSRWTRSSSCTLITASTSNTFHTGWSNLTGKPCTNNTFGYVFKSRAVTILAAKGSKKNNCYKDDSYTLPRNRSIAKIWKVPFCSNVWSLSLCDRYKTATLNVITLTAVDMISSYYHNCSP